LFEIGIVDSLVNLLLFDLIWTSPAIVDGDRREGGSHRAWKENGKKNGGGYGVKRSGVQQVGNFGLPSKFY
jgi:hypothetical protein